MNHYLPCAMTRSRLYNSERFYTVPGERKNTQGVTPYSYTKEK